MAIASDVLIAREPVGGALVKVLDLPLPRFGFDLAFVPDHPTRATVDAFHAWAGSVA